MEKKRSWHFHKWNEYQLSNKRPVAHEFVKWWEKRWCLRGLTSIPWEILTFLFAYKWISFPALVLYLCTKQFSEWCMCFITIGPFPHCRGDSWVNLSKPFGTTRQEPDSYLGLHVNQTQVSCFQPNPQTPDLLLNTIGCFSHIWTFYARRCNLACYIKYSLHY